MAYHDENWGDLVRERFPTWGTDEKEAIWAELKRNLVVGQMVTGEVIARAPFGVWLDLGLGFPALLSIGGIVGLTHDRYISGDWCPIGSQVTAFITGARDTGKSYQIWVWQIPPNHQKSEQPSR